MYQINKVTIIPVIFILFLGYAVWALLRPVTPIQPTIYSSLLNPIKLNSNLSWPTSGQSAVGIEGSNIFMAHEVQTPSPTASTAKMITALTVLKVKPLALNSQGPIITLGPNDVAIYNKYVSEQGSVVQVVNGEKISELQMLQAMLLPSANNMADSLAIWAYGSLPNYSVAANNYVKSLGLSGTRIGIDASGYSPTTTSTSVDLVKVGEQVMSNPVLSSIVGQPSATGIPVVTTVKNVNFLLGTNNIIGVKTGNTDQAGGVYVSASKVNINDDPVTIVTANLAASTLSQAVNGSLPLIKSSQTNIGEVKSLTNGTIVGVYTLPWDKSNVDIKLNGDLSAVAWKNGTVTPTVTSLADLKYPVNQSLNVGTMSLKGNSVLGSNEVPLYISGNVSKPTLSWRLLHP